MAAGKGKKKFSAYILPLLFCGLLVTLAVLKGQPAEQPVKAVLQEGEPLTLTDQAVENYLYAAGFSLQGEALLDAEGKEAGALTATKGSDGCIQAMTLSFPVTAYVPTEDDEGLASLKAMHDSSTQRGEELFLSLFDAIAATDARVANRRDSALEKLCKTMDTGKASTQAANTWRFSFSLAPGLIEGTVTVLCEKVK